MNNKTLVVGLLLFSLLAAALAARNADIAWMMLPFLAYLGAGIWQTPPLEKLRLTAERSAEEIRLSGIRAVRVKVSVRNQAAETVCLCIREQLHAGIKITGGRLSQRAALRSGECAEFSYTFTAARGNYSWETVSAVVGDPLGLMETELPLPASAMIQVQPPINKFKPIPFRPRSTLHAPGSIPARLGGSGTDFFGVRKYQPGDSLRRLDWRQSARHPRQLFTKEFEQEEIAEISLILDARPRTDLRVGAESLFEFCVGATASLAEMFLHQGHRTSLLVFGEPMLHAFPGYGKIQLHRILGCLSRARVETAAHKSGLLDFMPIRMFPSHALVIIISSLTSADPSLFRRLRAFGYSVLLISPDPIDFAGPTLKRDAAGRLALRATRLERRLRLNSISELQIPVIDWQVRRPLFPLVRSALTRSSGRRE